MRRTSFILLAAIVYAIGAMALHSQVFSNEAGSDRSGPSIFGERQGRYPACTPADYGDPSANCIPANRTSIYSPYSDSMGASPYPVQQMGIPSMLDMSPLPPERNRGGEPQESRVVKEPPTEFQRYVAASTGMMLPIFGASLFEHVPATFAPVYQVPVGSDYKIATGDELQVAIWGQVNAFRRLLVDRNGQVILPNVGPISVAGMNYSQAASVFKLALAHVYKNFDVSVTLGRLHSIQIFVVGEARRPGSYTVSSLSTLVNAIFASGGPSSRGSMRDIQLKRGGKTICSFDLYQLLLHGDKSKDMQLEPGDVILIPPASRRVAIAGSVERPAIYELKNGATLGGILRLCDGLSPIAAAQEAIVDRVADGSALKVERIKLNSAGMAAELHNGDIVRLLTVVPRFEKAVTLRGNVANPGKFPWYPGMRLDDLIPNKESLLTRDYWDARNRLGGEGLPGFTGLEKIDGVQAQPVAGKPASSGKDAVQPAYREEQRNLHADSSLGAATSGDHVPPIRDFLPRNTVQPSAPEIDWKYAVIERIDKKTFASRLVPFNLGALVLQHEPSQNLPLQPGDVVTIFSKADFSVPSAQQAKQVRIEGEVAMAGVYTLSPGETLRDLVEQAGGLTRNAYLYGAQFTRESTRREQQKRYDDFLDQLEREMAESAATLPNRVISPQQAVAAQTASTGQHELIERLRKVAIDGRIVLDSDPRSRGVQALPDLPLENGDRLYVPSRPSTVNVIGAVFEQTTFLYQEDLRVKDYLKKAGGPMRSADRGHMFIVRADGSIVSRTATQGVLFANSFHTLRMYPGDTLVVPTFVNKPTFARNLMDWSQIVGNLALGAAAVNVLH